MVYRISMKGYETSWNMRRILCIELLVPRFRLKSFIHVLDRNVIGHVSARGKGIARESPCGQTHNGILFRVDKSKRQGQGEFEVSAKTNAIFEG